MEQIKRILSPIDFSDNAGKVVEAAVYIAGVFQAELQLVFVVQNFEDYSSFFVPPVNMPRLEDELYTSAQQRMDAYIKELKPMLAEHRVLTVSGKILVGDIAEEILALTASGHFNLIVMGTHGYKGFERIMFGSVADKVVKNSCCPVMTINPYREECEKLYS
ncbi:MAG: universal stress protein [Desulfobulbus propionicus]|nr:MAG: universal stress protein [Desulfobulbus propionicus]